MRISLECVRAGIPALFATLVGAGATGCAGEPGPATDSPDGTDTAFVACEHPLDAYPDRERYATLDLAVAACARDGSAPTPEPCGGGWWLCCACGDGTTQSLLLYFDAGDALVAARRGTDAPEYCDGTAYEEVWGDVPACG